MTAIIEQPAGAATAPAGRVWTIGHSTRDLADLVYLLRKHKITRLVDVRSSPTSARHPQWYRTAMEHTLPAAGIAYCWLPRLGGHRSTRRGVTSVNTAWRHRSFRAYADYMASPAFADGLQQLQRLAAADRVAYMCSEAVPWRCHRRMITDAMLAAGWTVTDILTKPSVRSTGAQDAAINPAARLHDGHLIYPAGGHIPDTLPGLETIR